MSARSVPRSRIRIFRMNNCWANAYLRAKAGEQINVHAPGTVDDARRELMRIALLQLILRSRTSEVPPVRGERRVPCRLQFPGRICGNDVEPDAKEIVFLHAMELFGGSKVLVALFRRVSAWNIQATFIPNSGCFLPRRGYAASCALRRAPCCSGASRVRFVFRVSSPFAIRTAQRWRSPKLRMPRRLRRQPRKRLSAAAARARMRARPAPRDHAGTAPRPQASADVPARIERDVRARIRHRSPATHGADPESSR